MARGAKPEIKFNQDFKMADWASFVSAWETLDA
jgi:hypothetical protein